MKISCVILGSFLLFSQIQENTQYLNWDRSWQLELC